MLIARLIDDPSSSPLTDRYIASDCDSVALIYGAHGYAKSPEEAVADVLKAGKQIDLYLPVKIRNIEKC